MEENKNLQITENTNSFIFNEQSTVDKPAKITNLNPYSELFRKPKIVETKLSGDIWGITTFFNPAGYKIKYQNYKKFWENLKKQKLKLLAVELSFEKKPFELKEGDADIIIQVRGKEENIMWQKEALLNIGLQNLPKECDKIVWLDCDLIFKNENWVRETAKLLEKYCVIQPFSEIYKSLKYSEPTNFSKMKFGIGEGFMSLGTPLFYEQNGFAPMAGSPGYAWAARKDILDKAGFYDKFILGGGDRLLQSAFYNYKKICDNYCLIGSYYNSQSNDFEEWYSKISELVNASVYYTPGLIIHLFHGYEKNRNYVERKNILSENKFDPLIDIKKNNDGIYSWSSTKNELHETVKKYFYSRAEE